MSVVKRVRCDLPHVTKCPLLHLVVSVLVLYIDSLEEVFALTERLLSDALCPLARSPNQALADDNTLRDLALLKLKSDKIRQWISSSQKATSDWREWLFSLPLPLLVSFVDCLLLEGPKIKFRFALAFLTLAKNFGFFDAMNSNCLKIRAKEASEMLANERFDSFKILPKAFGIKRLSWNTCKTLISRHMVLLDISAGASQNSFLLKVYMAVKSAESGRRTRPCPDSPRQMQASFLRQRAVQIPSW